MIAYGKACAHSWSHYISFKRLVFHGHEHSSSSLLVKGKACTRAALSSPAETSRWDSEVSRFPNGYGNIEERSNVVRKKKKEVENGIRDDEEDEVVLIGGRKVKCVVEVISWRERRVKGEITVSADVGSVWDALTDYERLADFIPNLVFSGRIPCPFPGRIWLEQRGLQQALYWHIEARVILDLQELIHSDNDRELSFSMVDGDFKKFEGKWSVKSHCSQVTVLGYEVSVIPRFNFPAIFLERIIRSDLPINLQAVACRSEANFVANHSVTPQDSLTTLSSPSSLSLERIGTDKAINGDTKKEFAKSSFGPLSPSSGGSNYNRGIFGKSCSLDKPCTVDEVHLRRYGGVMENGGVHRCIVASITIKAPIREVWNVLTAYETLPEIVPNLVISRVLSRQNNKVRILQEGCKGLLYMVLHARVVLDLSENPQQEIRFEQVEGDFDEFQGKWTLEKLGSHHTLLKYSVETKTHPNPFLSEAIMEEVVYEDLPSNLCAIRDYLEKRESEEFQKETLDEGDKTSSSLITVPSNSSRQRRPKVPGLQRDIEVLKSELLKFISEHGQEGFMPMRKQLRKHGRVDIEKAITRMGGFRRIASVMNLSLAYKHRKPKGYWDNLENLQEEIIRFQSNWGMDPSFMPSRKTFERAGRYDIARALEKWGGLHEVSRLLSLKVRHPNRQVALSKDKVVDNIACNGQDSSKLAASRTYVSQDTQKWLLKLRDLDISWVE